MAMDFAYGRTLLSEIDLHGVRNLETGRFSVTGLTVDGQLVVPTRGFWDDLFHRFRLTNDWAQHKSDARRFEWLVAHFGEYEIPYRVEWDAFGNTILQPRRRKKMRRPKVDTHHPRRAGTGWCGVGAEWWNRPVRSERRACHGRLHPVANAI